MLRASLEVLFLHQNTQQKQIPNFSAKLKIFRRKNPCRFFFFKKQHTRASFFFRKKQPHHHHHHHHHLSSKVSLSPSLCSVSFRESACFARVNTHTHRERERDFYLRVLLVFFFFCCSVLEKEIAIRLTPEEASFSSSSSTSFSNALYIQK